MLQSVIRQNDIDAGVSMQKRKAGLITCTADRNRRHRVAGDEERFVPHFPRIRFGRNNLDFIGLAAKAAGDDAGGPASSSKLPNERNRDRRFAGAPHIDVAHNDDRYGKVLRLGAFAFGGAYGPINE